MKSLNDIEWKEFEIKIFFDIQNSKAYHRNELTSSNKGIPYITRTNLNNGLDDIVLEKINIKINPSNTIVFGAENATFFYHPYEYITGNKMYFLSSPKINKYTGLFLVQCLNKSIKDCGFGYGQGLTGTRVQKRHVVLPINNKEEINWQFMEDYTKNKEQELKNKYKKQIEARIKKLEKFINEDKEWQEFYLKDIFNLVQRGKRLKNADHIYGERPYVSSTFMNNGVDDYVSNKDKVRIFDNCLTLANSGSVGSSFYQPYKFVASDHITALKTNSFSKYVYLFIATMTARLSQKYDFNREINDKRINREIIMLPVNVENQPDYEYMENYMKYIEQQKLLKYINFIGFTALVSE